jgi:flagellar FliL protein
MTMTQDAQEPTFNQPHSGSARWVLLIAAALLAVGLGAGAVYYFNASPAPAVAPTSPPKRPAQYIAFDPPFVVNFENAGLMRFLQVSVEVMTRDEQTAQLLRLHDPRLRNDLLLLLGNQTYEAIATREGKEALRAQALQAVAAVISAEGGKGAQVEQLYFTSFVMQ